jgi:hypothetical protein
MDKFLRQSFVNLSTSVSFVLLTDIGVFKPEVLITHIIFHSFHLYVLMF